MAPFVYQKKNKGPREGAEVCEVYCKKATCDIQYCLARLRPSPRTGQYDHSQCDYAIAAYDKCCEAAIKKHGTPGSSGLTKPANINQEN
mmetsp:Transcript_39517/g.86073  ORF Transcript_39517/g.86073 Transcript_39517/m.86073 type:complete len:89 (+) Transcript_39517:220-486(+)